MEIKTWQQSIEEAKKWDAEMREAARREEESVKKGLQIDEIAAKRGMHIDKANLQAVDAPLLMSYAERTYPRDVFPSLAEGLRRMLNAAYSDGLEMGREEQKRKGGQIY